jgi:hypothetical protein
MLPQAVLLVAIAGAFVGFADDGTTSLAEAVRAVNERAAKAPESRVQKPLTEDQVVRSITDLTRDDGRLSEADYRELQRIAKTRRLPKNVILRQFVRYNDGTEVRHGWWVRLMLLRDSGGTFSLTVREELLFRRPYTQKERLFQDEVGRTGMGTLNRLVAYFDEDPKVAVVQQFSPQEADRLADAVKKAVTDKKAEDLLKTYHWEGVNEGTRAEVRAEAEQFMKRRLSSVSVSPRRFGGRLHHWQGFRTWDPNLPVRGYVVLEFADSDGPKSVWLEFGETQLYFGEMQSVARLVNYVVSRDDGPGMVGKRLSGPIRVQGFPLVPLKDGWFEWYLQIDAPDDMPALQNANFELRKIRPTPHADAPPAETRDRQRRQ